MLALNERSGFRLLANALLAEGFDARSAKLFRPNCIELLPAHKTAGKVCAA